MLKVNKNFNSKIQVQYLKLDIMDSDECGAHGNIKNKKHVYK